MNEHTSYADNDAIELLSVTPKTRPNDSSKQPQTAATYIVPEAYDYKRLTERKLWHVLNPIPSLAITIVLGALSGLLQNRLADTLCIPNGDMALPGSFSIWKAEYGLSITVGFWKLAFAQAKAIDLAWDIIIGRGGQALLIWMAYHVFSRLIIHIMKEGDITCDLYAAVAFQTASLGNTWTLFLDFALGNYPKTWHSVMCYITMIICSIYIIAFPTLVSAMTSYGAISHAVISDGSVSVPFEDSNQVKSTYSVLFDGARVGKSNDYDIYDEGDFNMTLHIQDYLMVKFPRSLEDLKSTAKNVERDYMMIASEFNSTNNQALRLDPPLLKILNFSAFSDLAWTHGSTLVFTSEILGLDRDPLGSCAPTKDYQWGFSFILLFAVSAAHTTVHVALYGLLWYTRRQSQGSEQRRYRPHMWRAVVDLSRVGQLQCGERFFELPTSQLSSAMEGRMMTLTGDRLQSSTAGARRMWTTHAATSSYSSIREFVPTATTIDRPPAVESRWLDRLKDRLDIAQNWNTRLETYQAHVHGW
ncbi:hypothetical protein PRZ48_004130 [Zasmidium cellare]|uniref:Uncharacterized protein n=1 Tax=Zasmidium cellare TaxID=395010 RepID=A0ABR0EXK5_ZASCE|nr:hypothetical protein PRZ48_004130 [Zasmidium cellare]